MATNGHHVNGANSTNGTDRLDNGHPDLPALCHTASDFLSQSYDFIIVGGGTAGLVLAARLTEDPSVHVGVLEAGPSRLNDPLVDTPAAFVHMLGNPEYDWCLKTTPQKANNNIVHHVTRGKMLGGSSGINYMMYVRGADADYKDWATLLDDPAWSSEAMKPYMRKHQTLEPIDPSITDVTYYPFIGEHHGTNGPCRTSFNDTPMPLETPVIEALAEAAGLPKRPIDPWSGDHTGFYNSLGSVARTGPHKGKRSYAARGYFEANATRPNLKALCDASVSRISLEDGTATGVDFAYAGQTYHVKANKEVLLCGGTIHSPQILELSGIGDQDTLTAAGVDCKIHLPDVGEHLQDHCLSVLGYELTSGLQSGDILHNPEVMAAVQKQYVETKGGPLSNIAGVQGFVPYKEQSSRDELEQTIQSIRDTQALPKTSPFYKEQLETVIAHLQDEKSGDMSFYFVPLTVNFETGVQTQHLFQPPESGAPNQVVFAGGIQYPVSRGSIHITSSDVSIQPRIDFNYLSHPADVDVLATTIRFMDRASHASPLADKISRRTYPKSNIDLSHREQAKQAGKDWCMSTYHPMGTCAMGPVLDSRLKVRGVKGLRVCDASVFPGNVSGNICSSVYMVAERGADIIKEDHGLAK